MSTAKEIEQAVLALPPAELEAFRRWFADYDQEAWDRQLEADVAAGRLDALADAALASIARGDARDL
jgi:hypothetical protein